MENKQKQKKVQKEECLEHVREGKLCNECKYYVKGRCGIHKCL